MLSFLAQRTAAGQVCAWVDADDAFDPESAAANGVNLRQLLWVRCRKAGGPAQGKQAAKPWTRLDQALRATDLLLQAGGFAAIVLDLGDTAAEHARRIPLATWFRFRQAADRARTSLVVLAQTGAAPGIGTGSNAQSSAALALECAAIRPVIAGGTVLRGFRYEVRNQRQRFTPFAVGRKKPPASVWPAACAWDTAGLSDDVAEIAVRRSVGNGAARMSQQLYACVHAAEFPAQALLRLRPDLQALPVAVLEGRAPLEQVCSMNRNARQHGAATGMTRLEAEALASQRWRTAPAAALA